MSLLEALPWVDSLLPNLVAAWQIGSPAEAVETASNLLGQLALQDFDLLAQQDVGDAAGAGEGGGGDGDGGAANDQPLTGFQKFISNPLILPVGLFILFYVTFILPERRRKADEAKMMSALKKNDRIVTVGGIHGTVVSTSPDAGVVTIRIDENSNTRIKINRTAVASILGDPKENKDSPKETPGETKDKA